LRTGQLSTDQTKNRAAFAAENFRTGQLFRLTDREPDSFWQGDFCTEDFSYRIIFVQGDFTKHLGIFAGIYKYE
tara:strand:- start:310 stop:531 length:222 start_codon:yes stop_codon:yes gene_type:complete